MAGGSFGGWCNTCVAVCKVLIVLGIVFFGKVLLGVLGSVFGGEWCVKSRTLRGATPFVALILSISSSSKNEEFRFLPIVQLESQVWFHLNLLC